MCPDARHPRMLHSRAKGAVFDASLAPWAARLRARRVDGRRVLPCRIEAMADAPSPDTRIRGDPVVGPAASSSPPRPAHPHIRSTTCERTSSPSSLRPLRSPGPSARPTTSPTTTSERTSSPRSRIRPSRIRHMVECEFPRITYTVGPGLTPERALSTETT